MLGLLKKDPVLSVSLIILVVFTLVKPERILNFPNFIDWKTIIALAGLLVITKALEKSGIFSHIARSLVFRVSNERSLALLLIFSAGVLSTFLTNDITLFITIPLTLHLRSFMENDVDKLVIFEALAVNVGSLLTPIGNPQNIFLWHQWKVPFLKFVYYMLPLEILLLSLLLLFTAIFFKAKPLKPRSESKTDRMDIPLFVISILLFAGFIFSIEEGFALYALGTVLLIYLIIFRRIVCKANWSLILLFIVFFLDVHLLWESFPIQNLILKLGGNTISGVFLLGIGTSQIISNVPAAILLSNFSNSWKIIAYGVNVGGNGLVIASLANIIALKMGGEKSTWKRFHYYSIPFLFLSCVLTLMFLL